MADALLQQLATWRQSRMAFREALVMPDGQRFFRDVIADFQRQDFAALDSGQHRHAYLERPRGASKTSDLAAEAVAELFLGVPGGRLYAAAVDRDQAALLHEAAAGWIRRTPLLAESVTTERWRLIVPATDTILTVLAADAPSSWGLQPTWVAADEFALWEGEGEDFWLSLWTATGKRGARVVVITTAGWDRTSLCWRVREQAQQEADWYFSVMTERAPWISEAWLEQQRRTLPPHVYARLHEGRWVENVGAYLTAAEVDAIFDDALQPQGARVDGGTNYTVGVDVGLTSDRTVVAVAHRAPDGIVHVDAIRTWRGSRVSPVELSEVEAEVLRLANTFGAEVVLDPYQAVLLGQRLQAKGLRVSEYTFSGEGRRRLFATILQFVKDRQLRCFQHEELRRELPSLEVTETASGWRVDHRPGRHDDHVVAVALAAHAAAREPQWATLY